MAPTKNRTATSAAVRSTPTAPSPRRPYPDGWFAIGFSHELRPGQVQRRRFMGEELVLYRTESGLPRVVRPHCPHLGAHLGVGGRVDGEDLVCPFHHFAFDPDGTCIRTGYGTPPPQVGLEQRTCHEANHTIMVWHHAEDAPPHWDVPKLPYDGFPTPATFTTTIIDHPQEIVENAVDTGHIGPVHRYQNARLRRSMETNGTCLTIAPAVERVLPIVGSLQVEFDVEAHGLGYLFVNAVVTRLRTAAQVQMMATPIDPCTVEIRFTVSARLIGAGKRLTRSRAAASGLITRVLARSFWKDITLDFPIWENKQFLERPKLARGDGPILQFRRWAAQFYSAEADQMSPTLVSISGTREPADT